jgi:hypothetical protein
MITRRVRFSRPPQKSDERIPPSMPMEPIVPHENGGWSIWNDDERFPSHEFARASWLRRNSRHRSQS